MTALSHVLDTMAASLRTDLSGVDVRVFDGRFGGDGKDHVTVKAPGVLLAVLGFDEDGDQEPVEVDAKFFAVCITRDHAAAAADPEATVERARREPHAVCADLAAQVTRVVKRQLWTDLDSRLTCIGRATRVKASNDYTNALSMKGHSAWAVTWNQKVQLDARFTTADLVNLSGIDFTLAMGPGDTIEEQRDNDTPNIEIQVDLPEDVV